MNALSHATLTSAPVQRSRQVHWCGFLISWYWDFADGEGPQEILVDMTASGPCAWTIHSIRFAGEFLDDSTEAVIAAVLEEDVSFRDYVSTRFSEEAEEQLAWER